MSGNEIEVKGQQMTETLLQILCWIGVVYFIVHFCQLIVLIGKNFVRRRRSSMQKERTGREPKTRQHYPTELFNDPARY